MTERTPHPAIAELFKLLPADGGEFTHRQRLAFLQSCAGLFALLYPMEPPLQILISGVLPDADGECVPPSKDGEKK